MGQRVYISADIEGITGIVHFDETIRGKDDFSMFRKMMTDEVNAVIEGALEAGASEVVVRDAHGDARNILPEKLNRHAKLIRGWADTPLCMMEGIDETFDAVMFVGYHAAADQPNATLKHTMSLRISELKVNDVLMAEAGLNALIAGMFGVPVAFIAGDAAVCQYARDTFGAVETVAVKEGIGSAAINLHPVNAKEMIRSGAQKAVSNLHQFKPYKLVAPYFFDIKYRYEHSAFKASFYPGTERLGNTEIRFTSKSLRECLHFFYFCQG